ncbi:hypothetical protein NECAME_18340, partial [Necator americanus]
QCLTWNIIIFQYFNVYFIHLLETADKAMSDTAKPRHYWAWSSCNELRGFVMSKSDLVVKSNRLNMAIQNLTLPELRIVQLAIVDARETGKGLNTDTPLRIDALRYAQAFDTTRQNGYARMKEAEDTLFNRRFSFIDSE